MSWARLRNFKPTELQSAATLIGSLHSEVAAPSAPDTNVVEKLKRLLERSKLEELPILLSRLSRRELLAVADVLATSASTVIRTKAAKLGELSKYGPLTGRCWKMCVDRRANQHLVQVVRSGLAQGFWNSVCEDEGDLGRVKQWVAGDQLAEGLLEDIESRRSSLGAWFDTLPRLVHPLRTDSFLTEEIRSAVLTKGNRQTLTTHQSYLMPWVDDLSIKSRAGLKEAFASNYLAQLRNGQAWSDDIVDRLLNDLGRPPLGSLVDVWRRIDKRSPGVVKELLSWMAMRDLESFFRKARDPHGRFKFWRDNFRDNFASVRPLAGYQAMLLHMPPIIVVEFAEVGNAAYVYSERERSWLEKRGGFGVSYYKRRDNLLSRPSDGREFRIFHQKGWEGRYLNDLKVALRSR